MENKAALTEHKITVLLIDDQPLVGEAVRRMLVKEPDITFHYCKDPAKAAEIAATVKPTVILQDLVIPEVDDLRAFVRDRPAMTPTAARECRIAGTSDAVLQAVTRLRGRGYVEAGFVPGCVGARFQPTECRQKCQGHWLWR